MSAFTDEMPRIVLEAMAIVEDEYKRYVRECNDSNWPGCVRCGMPAARNKQNGRPRRYCSDACLVEANPQLKRYRS